MQISSWTFLTSLLLNPAPYLSSIPPQANVSVYHLLQVFDGDSFLASRAGKIFSVRIGAMDAPEKGQAYAEESMRTLEKFLQAGPFTLKLFKSGLDRYGRLLAQVLVNNEDVAVKMIEQGMATYYRPNCRDYPKDKERYDYLPTIYVQAENKAKKEKLGIWSRQAWIEWPCRYRRRSVVAPHK